MFSNRPNQLYLVIIGSCFVRKHLKLSSLRNPQWCHDIIWFFVTCCTGGVISGTTWSFEECNLVVSTLNIQMKDVVPDDIQSVQQES